MDDGGQGLWARELRHHLGAEAAEIIGREAARQTRGEAPAECPREFEVCSSGGEEEPVGSDTKSDMVARQAVECRRLRAALKEAEERSARLARQRDDLLAYQRIIAEGWWAEADERRRLQDEVRRLGRGGPGGEGEPWTA